MSNATLTRAHFEAMAQAIRRARYRLVLTATGAELQSFDNRTVPLIADELSFTNPSFNRERFIEAALAPYPNGVPLNDRRN